MNRVLIIDDSTSIRKLLNRLLSSKKYNIEQAVDAFDGMDKIISFKPNVILLDISMPGKSGIELCKELKSNIKTNNIYIIMLTVYRAGVDETRGFDAGADDYICKPFDMDRLLARVQRGITENVSREETLRDPLTQLYNRRFFNSFLVQEESITVRYSRNLSLLLLDIDHFKIVNDVYGHKIGDNVLESIGQILISQARTSDIPVRWGGEELVILMPETNIEGALIKAEEIRVFIANNNFPPTKGITVSIGVATYIKGEDMLKNADKALYKAKEGGRNRVES